MPLLPLALGWLALAADPGPSGPAADLVRVARLGPAPGRDPAPAAAEVAEYAVEAAPRGELSFVLPAGPRTVRALEVEPGPAPASAEGWRRARLRLTWEDDDPLSTAPAAVDLPVGLAFGRGAGLPPVESAAVGSTAGGAWVNRFPMPYRTGALLRVSTDRPIAGRIRVRTTRGVAADAGYLRGDLLSAGSGAVAGTGRGQLAGVFAVTEGPAPAGPGKLVVDGKPGGTLAATLGLDARRDPARSGPGPSRGVLVAQGDAGRSAAYRWFLAAPVAFHDSFTVEAGGGGDDARQTAAVFWYSENPGGRRPGP